MEKLVLKDNGVIFDEEAHKYYYNGKELKGITSTIIQYMFPDTYANVSQEVLDKAAERGHYIHSCIEMSDVVGATEDCPESAAFLRMMEENGMTVVAHEYIVTDYKEFASPIDLVLQDKDGKVWLADIKTTSSLHKPKVRLQLSIYAAFFEANTGYKVEGVAEVWLPKEQYGKPQYIVLPRTDTNKVNETIIGYFNLFDPSIFLKYYDGDDSDNLPAMYREIMAEIAAQEILMKNIKERTDTMKAQLLAAFREFGVKKVDNEYMTITYVAPTTKESVDSKVLKKDYPEVYASCMKTSSVSDSIRIKLK